jgi:hypothetical protein
VRGINERIYSLVGSHADRLGIDKDKAYLNALRFAHWVGQFENDGMLIGNNRPQEGHSPSSAKGLYQFIDGSVGPARNRLGRHMDVSGLPNDPNDMTWEQQTLLLLADLLEKKGSDRYMSRVLSDCMEGDIEIAYYTLHHTAPDKRTKDMTRGKLHG